MLGMSNVATVLVLAQVTRKGAAESSERYKNFIQVTQIEETEVVDAAYYSTLCSTCRVVCHDKCQTNEYIAPGTIPASKAAFHLLPYL